MLVFKFTVEGRTLYSVGNTAEAAAARIGLSEKEWIADVIGTLFREGTPNPFEIFTLQELSEHAAKHHFVEQYLCMDVDFETHIGHDNDICDSLSAVIFMAARFIDIEGRVNMLFSDDFSSVRVVNARHPLKSYLITRIPPNLRRPLINGLQSYFVTIGGEK